MYYAIGRLEASQFVTLDFTPNFGISSEVRTAFIEAMQNGGNYDQV
jgi:hypothetical protein